MTVYYCTNDPLRRISRKLSMTFNGASQLSNEKHQSFIKGDADDMKTLWCLDQEIARLIQPFKGVGFVSEDVKAQIDEYISALAPVFKRVAAYQQIEPSTVEQVFDSVRGLAGYDREKPEERQVPVRYLEYYCPFTSAHGGRIEQRVASIRLG